MGTALLATLVISGGGAVREAPHERCCAPEFVVLGDLSGGYTASSPAGVSSDGSRIVGLSYISFESHEGFLWEPHRGMIGLGDLPGGTFYSSADAVSEDGAVIVGEGDGEHGGRVWQLIDDEMVALPDPNVPVDHTAFRAMSCNGRFKAGIAYNEVGHALVMWAGLVPGVFSFSGEFYFHPTVTALSDDARIMIGFRLLPTGYIAFRAEDRIVEDLGDLPGGPVQSQVGDMTPDGRVIVGSGFEGIGQSRAFFWTRQRGLVPFPNNPEGNRPVSADGISADGWVVTGVLAVGFSQTTYVWNPIDGARSLKQILENQGLNLDGLNPRFPTDLTPDGTIVIGSVTTPEGHLAFRARIPPFCYADCDRTTGRGTLDAFDFLEFQRRFALQDLYSDCDQNAQYDIFDYLCFLNHYSTGCP